jgi:hypothetical protein
VLPILALAAFTVAQAARSLADGLAAICTIGAVGVVFVGPQILRNDLRQDLTQIATFKSWPLRGATIVRGEVLAPTVLLTSIVWLLLLGAAILWGSVTFDTHLSVTDRISYGVAGMVVAPGVILIEVVAQNALVVMFPEWMDLGASSTRGMEVMGQRMLIAGALVLLVGVALIPAIVAAAMTVWALFVLIGTPTIIVPSAVAAAVLFAEAALVINRVGHMVDRMDASAVPVAD